MPLSEGVLLLSRKEAITMRSIARGSALIFFGALTIAPVANAQVIIARPFNPVTETFRQRQLAQSIAAQQRLFGQMRTFLSNANTTIAVSPVQPPIFIPSPPINSAPGTFFPTVAVSPVQPPIFIPS